MLVIIQRQIGANTQYLTFSKTKTAWNKVYCQVWNSFDSWKFNGILNELDIPHSALQHSCYSNITSQWNKMGITAFQWCLNAVFIVPVRILPSHLHVWWCSRVTCSRCCQLGQWERGRRPDPPGNSKKWCELLSLNKSCRAGENIKNKPPLLWIYQPGSSAVV